MSEKLKQDHFKVTPKSMRPEITPGERSGKADQYLQGRGAQFNTKNNF